TIPLMRIRASNWRAAEWLAALGVSILLAADGPAEFAAESHPFALRVVTQKAVFPFKVYAVGQVSAEVRLKKRGQLIQVILHGPKGVSVKGRQKANDLYLAYAQNTNDVLANGNDWTVVVTSFTDEEVVSGTVTISYPKGASSAPPGTIPPPNPGASVLPPGAPPPLASGEIRLSSNAVKATESQFAAVGATAASIEISGIHFDSDHTIELLQKEDRAFLESTTESSTPPGVTLSLKGLSPGWFLVEAQFTADGKSQSLTQKAEVLSGKAEVTGPAGAQSDSALYLPLLVRVTEVADLRIQFSADHVFFESIRLRKLSAAAYDPHTSGTTHASYATAASGDGARPAAE
ncbi:MAG: hypothetical protein ACREJQ_08700, partial [bacterium]